MASHSVWANGNTSGTPLEGVAVGHATDLALGSGVTAIVFDAPAAAGVLVLGGAPGTRDTDLLAPENSVERIDALVLSGGSAFGLDAAGGVQAALREAGRGFEIRGMQIPLVPEAILFDLANGGNKDWGRFSPYRDLGYRAATAARSGPAEEGTVGAGTGATTATVKGGFGCAFERTPAGHTVAAFMAVNAVGTPTVGSTPCFWAAPFERDGEFGARGWPVPFPADALALRTKGASMPSTTIGVVVTDAVLTKGQAKRLAIMAHDGLARAIVPAHAPMDGDTIFAAATGVRPLADAGRELMLLGHSAGIAVARAIGRGVYAATALPMAGAQPSWRDRFG